MDILEVRQMATPRARRLTTSVATDYLSLTKPRVVLLHLITAASAMFLAANGLPPASALLFTLAGGGLMAGAANTLNCYLDRDLDGMMPRTHHRPLPAATLALGALTGYVLAYTMWLKRRSYWATIVGSAAGATPPLVGWVAMDGRPGLTPLLLFVIIWLWTPPHFWALAIFRRGEYESVGLSVLPPADITRSVTVCTSLLLAATLLLVPAAHLGTIYLSSAVVLGWRFLHMALRLRREESPQLARHLYFYSILYLVLLSGAMAIDRLFPMYLW